MSILDAGDFTQEVFEIRCLGEARELGTIVEPYVQHALDAGLLEQSEESLRAFLSESDRVESHLEPSSRPVSTGREAKATRRLCTSYASSIASSRLFLKRSACRRPVSRIILVSVSACRSSRPSGRM